MIMTVVRKFHKAFNRVREGNFLLDGLAGFNLYQKTVGIIGTGQIGLVVGRILSKGFACNVIAFDPYPNVARAEEYGITYVAGLDEVFERSDIISLHCPLNEGSRHLVNEHTLGLMKEGSILINTSRGGLIDTDALIVALKRDKLAAVALDVYDGEGEYFFKDSSAKVIHDDRLSRLISFHHVFITGHQAFLTKEALKAIATTTLENLAMLERGEMCANQVKAD